MRKTLLVGAAVAAVAAGGAIALLLPDIKRYLKIRSM
ncbi:DUF6893 family small protein [Streptomyces sp. NPDC048644]